MNKQYIILVPGLGDHANRVNLVTKHWETYGVIPIVHEVPWKHKKEALSPKLDRLVKKIDVLTKDGSEVSLVGMSAGGSFVINAYLQRKSKIKKVVNICGRLRESGFPSLKFASRGFSAFKESVITSEQNLKKLTLVDKKKIMTFSPIFDEVVPLSAIPIAGARNIWVPYLYHSVAISLVLILNKKRIIDFVLR